MKDSRDLVRQARLRSRRGLLELDLILVPFTESQLPGCSGEVVDDYLKMLHEADHDILSWIHQRATVPGEYQRVVNEIRRYVENLP